MRGGPEPELAVQRVLVLRVVGHAQHRRGAGRRRQLHLQVSERLVGEIEMDVHVLNEVHSGANNNAGYCWRSRCRQSQPVKVACRAGGQASSIDRHVGPGRRQVNRLFGVHHAEAVLVVEVVGVGGGTVLGCASGPAGVASVILPCRTG